MTESRHHQAFLDAMSEGALTVSSDGYILFATPQFAGLVRRNLAEVLGAPLTSFFHPDHAAQLPTLFNAQSPSVELRLLEDDTVFLHLRRCPHAAEEPIYLLAADITQSKLAAHYIAGEQLAQSVREQLPVAILVMDPSGKILRTTYLAASFLGGPVLGRSFDDVVSLYPSCGPDLHFPYDAILAASHTEPIENLEVTARLENGTTHEFLVSAAALPGAYGELYGCVLTFTDITERKKAEEKNEVFKLLVEGVRDYAIYLIGPQGHVLSWNSGACRMKGYLEKEIVGQNFSRFYTPEDIAAGRPQNALHVALVEGQYSEEGWRVRRDGSRFWASVLLTSLQDRQGRHRGFSKLTHDISERKRAQELLLESERNLRLLADAMPQIVFTAGPDGVVNYGNRRWYDFTGFSPAAPIPETFFRIFHPDELPSFRETWSAAIESGANYETECRLWDRASTGFRWHLIRALPVRDATSLITHWIGTFTDIDESKRLNQQLEQRVQERTVELQRSLAEKTLLLKEVHHRVKNNLQVICSLLAMQIECSEGDGFAVPLIDANGRVVAMSLIHEQIYRSDNVSHLDFGTYIELLAGRLFSAYCVVPARVQLQLQISPIHFTVDQAIPCGLILNELLSNSLKHAFPDGTQGTIRISLRGVNEGHVELEVADNGQGLPANFRVEGSQSMGMQVVSTLAQQIRAELTVTHGSGATFRLRFLPQAVN